MTRIFTLLSFIILCGGILNAQTELSGIINSYGAVSNINNTDPCAAFLTIDDASPFNAGDYILIIQMKGAEVDTTNSASFGEIVDLNSCGLYEKAQILSVSGSDIYLSTVLENNYDVNGYVQIVNILQYDDVNVMGNIYPMAWDGTKGGVIAMEVTNTLSLTAGSIDASEAGFRGGVREVLDSECNFQTSYTDYHYPLGNFRGAAKGEGIVELLGKENGRGPLGTGGGGGNDHNTGGGGGSNVGAGGQGGVNLSNTPTACLGQYPGIGGVSNPSSLSGERLFMGGGGGAGHDNNGTGSDGSRGGGIVYLKANALNGAWNLIRANGQVAQTTFGFDGAGGGGAGGSIFLDVPVLSGGLFLEARGGKGGDFEALNSNGCMGPGGGGGGGLIFTDIAAFSSIDISGGPTGVIVNSTSTCNGTSATADPGQPGASLTVPQLVAAAPVIHINIANEPTDVLICDNEVANFNVQTDIPGDQYQWNLNDGNGYVPLIDGITTAGATSPNLVMSDISEGSYLVQCIIYGGCGDTLMTYEAILDVETSAMFIVQPTSQSICEGEEFVLTTEVNGSNTSYQWQLDNGNGFMDIFDGNTYSGTNTNTLAVEADPSMNGYQFQCIANNDCPGMATSSIATLTIAPLAVPDFSYTISNDTVFVMSNSSGETDIYWDFGDGSPLHPAGTPYYIYEESGTYTVTIYAVNDCGTTSYSETIDINIEVVSSIGQIDEGVYFILGPNPTKDFIYIDLSGESFHQAEMILFDMSGKEWMAKNISDPISSIDLGRLPMGVYLLQVKIGERSSIHKVIKQ